MDAVIMMCGGCIFWSFSGLFGGENKYVGWKRHTKQMKFGDLVGFKKSDIEKAW